MELKQLEYFLAVSNNKSFTRAAEQLYVSQPSVTTAIKKLEDELGLILFDRNKKQAILTSEGEIFYQHAGTVMKDISKAAQKAAELKNLSSGNIRIGISPLTCLAVSSLLLAKFHNMYPTLKFCFTEASSGELRLKLSKGQIDLAFLPILPDELELEQDLEFAPVSNKRLSVYLPTFHLLAGKTQVTLRDLKQELFLLPREDCGYRPIIDQIFTKQQQITHLVFETSYPTMIAHLIVAGSGIAILPAGAISSPKITEIPLADSPTVLLTIARKQKRTIAHAAEKLYSFLQESYED